MVQPHFSWHTVSMDVVGPLPCSGPGFCYVIVAIDYLTKWVKARSLRKVDAPSTAKFFLDAIILCHGCPPVLLSDNGTNFTASVI